MACARERGGGPGAATAAAAVVAQGRAALRDLFLSPSAGGESLADELEREMAGLADGAAALGQWRRARAAAAPLASSSSSSSSSSCAAGAARRLLLPPARLLQELAHDRMHTGTWSAVPEAWRNAHAAGTLAAVGARLLAMEEEEGGGGGGAAGAEAGPPALSDFLLPRQREKQQQQQQQQQTETLLLLSAALRALDVAIILGAPCGRLRAALDAAAERADAALGGEEEEDGGGRGKRRRVGGRAAPPPPPPPRLPPRSLAAASAARLPSCDRLPALDAFLAGHMLPRRPLLVRASASALGAWPALARWRDRAYLLGAAGRRTVPVEAGAHFLDPRLATVLMPFGEFLRRIEEDGEEEEEEEEEEEDGDEGGGGGGGVGPPCPARQQRLYLAQHPLLDQLPRLRRDVLVPDYCAMSTARADEAPAATAPAINAWLGGPGAVTPLHHDGARHNLLCVVTGRKYVRLYPPGGRTEAALRPLAAPHANASGIEPADLLLPRRRGNAAASSPAEESALAALDADVMCDAMVGPGEALYIPPGWWHYVSSWGEEEEREEEAGAARGGGGGGGREAAAAAAAPPPPPPAPPPRYCFAVSFWWS